MGFRDARISAGLSVSQVMKNIGVSDAAVYQWETGVTRPNAKRLLEIARLYNQPTRVYRLTGCDGWPYPSQSSTVGGDVAKSSKC